MTCLQHVHVKHVRHAYLQQVHVNMYDVYLQHVHVNMYDMFIYNTYM